MGQANGTTDSHRDAKKRLSAGLRHITLWTVILAFVAIEIFFDILLLKIIFYTLIVLYLALLVFRAIRNRKTIEFKFEKGTKTALGDRFEEASKILGQELDTLSIGYRIGFLQAFTKEFSKIDKSAYSKPGRIDKLFEFAEYAFPFQNVMVAVASTYLRRIAGGRVFKVSVSVADDGDYLFHANSQNEDTAAILVSRSSLADCLKEGAERMYYELNAGEMTRSYQAFSCYVKALRLWEKTYYNSERDDTAYNPAAECFRKALAYDPTFILAALYLGAMHSIRRSSSSYFERSKRHLERVVGLCDRADSPGSDVTKKKLKGLALALTCNLTSQWLHRIGKYENEEIARTFAHENQKRAFRVIELLGASPLSIHEYAFSLHSMEQFAISNPADRDSIMERYKKAVDEYTLAMEAATATRDKSAHRRSMGNRAYVMTWLGAMLRLNPDGTSKITTVSRKSQRNEVMAASLFRMAENDMRSVAALAKSVFGNYSVANLTILYALILAPEKGLHCAALLCGLEEMETENGSLVVKPLPQETIRRFDPNAIVYIEGANDIASALLATFVIGKVKESLRKQWLDTGIKFHQRSLSLIQASESENVASMRIRLVKQMTNLLKVVNYMPYPDSGTGARLVGDFKSKLDLDVSRFEQSSELVKRWLVDLRQALDDVHL